MIHEEICTYEVAKLAKDAGFPTDEIKSWYYEYDGCPTKEIIDKHQYPNITQSLLQRWLREEKNLYISIIAYAKSKKVYYEWQVRYISALGNMNKASSVISIEKYRYNTYEFALEDALKYALENLI